MLGGGRQRTVGGFHQMKDIARGMTILTTRLLLRPLVIEDSELVVSWRNDPKNAELFLSPPPTVDQHIAWFASDRSHRVDYVIVLRDSGDVVGTLNYVQAGTEKVAETGTLIGSKQHRGMGVASEAKLAWTLFGFAVLDIEQIMVRIRSDNERMIRIDEKLGYENVGSESMNNALGVPHLYRILRLARRRVLELPHYAAEDHHGFLEAIRYKEALAGI